MNMSHLKIYLVAIAYLLVFATAAAQDPTTYIFDGSVNNVWTTSDNWSPNYPGTSTAEGDVIIIDALCRASGMSIEIGGELIINPGNTLNISTTSLNVTSVMTIHGELSIQAGGTFTNLGYSTVKSTGSITNMNTVVNKSTLVIEGAVINNGDWTNAAFSEIQLLSPATFNNANTLTNYGVIEDYSSGFVNNQNFDNNGEFSISGAFTNVGNLTNLSTIFVEGSVSTNAGSNLFNHKLLDISTSGSLINSGTTYIFSAAQLSNDGSVVNTENGIIFNQGTLSTKGGVNFTLKPGSYLENRPGSVVSVN
jgi:hypothetical protein